MTVIVHVESKKQKIRSVCVKSLESKKVVNVIVDYMLKSNDERVVVNDYIENDPLSENNLDKTLNLVNEFRLSSPQKSIWIYTGYEWSDLWCDETALREDYGLDYCEVVSDNHKKRQQIISECDVLIDGRYIESQRDVTLQWCGSANQRIWKKTKEGEWVIYK